MNQEPKPVKHSKAELLSLDQTFLNAQVWEVFRDNPNLIPEGKEKIEYLDEVKVKLMERGFVIPQIIGTEIRQAACTLRYAELKKIIYEIFLESKSGNRIGRDMLSSGNFDLHNDDTSIPLASDAEEKEAKFWKPDL